MFLVLSHPGHPDDGGIVPPPHVLLQVLFGNVPVPSQLSGLHTPDTHLYFGFVQLGVVIVTIHELLGIPVALSTQNTEASPPVTPVMTPLFTVTEPDPGEVYHVIDEHAIPFPLVSLHVAGSVTD